MRAFSYRFETRQIGPVQWVVGGILVVSLAVGLVVVASAVAAIALGAALLLSTIGAVSYGIRRLLGREKLQPGNVSTEVHTTYVELDTSELDGEDVDSRAKWIEMEIED